MFSTQQNHAKTKIAKLIGGMMGQIRGRQPRPGASRLPGREKIVFESLEQRVLMSADFTPVAQGGTAVHQSTQNGSLAGAGAEVSYDLALDPGQKISVAMNTDASVQASIQIFDSDGTTLLGSAQAGLPGGSAFLDSIAATSGGHYTLKVQDQSGSGNFSAGIFLNASVEHSVNNDTAASAQDLAPSQFTLPNGGLRYAVAGTTDAGTPDYFSIQLQGGQLASFALAATQGAAAGSLRLELRDAADQLIALGEPTLNFAQSLQNFAIPRTDTYYLRVGGDAGIDYTLTALQGSMADLESNNAVGLAQTLSGTGVALGSLGRDQQAAHADIRVAVLSDISAGSNGGGTGVINQLNDDTYYNFTATAVTAEQIDSIEKLNQYDVVVIGDPATHSALASIAEVLKNWVEDGGGLVGAGWLGYAAGGGNLIPAIDSVMPVDLTAPYAYDSGDVISVDQASDVTAGVNDFNPHTWINWVPADVPNGTVMATENGHPAVVIG
ncbi:MAG TPA: LEPR-XLL domain-containing protein, partial [Accumulibacter sp.]|nr:LEPR-XLL domain-containing protein [Accumulibacter sp.]